MDFDEFDVQPAHDGGQDLDAAMGFESSPPAAVVDFEAAMGLEPCPRAAQVDFVAAMGLDGVGDRSVQGLEVAIEQVVARVEVHFKHIGSVKLLASL